MKDGIKTGLTSVFSSNDPNKSLEIIEHAGRIYFKKRTTLKKKDPIKKKKLPTKAEGKVDND